MTLPRYLFDEKDKPIRGLHWINVKAAIFLLLTKSFVIYDDGQEAENSMFEIDFA